MPTLPVEKMRQLERRFSEIEARMTAGPDADAYVRLASEYAELQPVVAKIRDYEKTGRELADLKQMGVGPEDYGRVNVNGSGIGLGHPVGSTGARLIVTLIYAMKNRGDTLGLATLCGGGGVAMACAIEMV